MKNSGSLRYAIALSLAATLLVGCGQAEQQQPPQRAPEVGVYTIDTRSLALTAELPGRTSAYRVAEVRPQVTGILQERLFTEGAEVEKGQQLYQIDPRTYEANLARAEANLKTAENLAKRYERLLKTNAVSQQQYDDAMAGWTQARTAVDVARIDMQYTRVLSPISGRIGRSAVTEGALVTNGQPQALATVTQLDPIYVDVNAPITRMLELQRDWESGRLQAVGEDPAVTLQLEDGSAYPLPGVLKFSEVTVSPTTGAVTLRAEFPNPDLKLLPGMFVRAQLQEGVQDDAILVPQQAVFRDTRGVANVWVISEDGSAQQREVETLRTVGNTWLIGKGLQSGDRVVTEGLQLLRNGMQVVPVAASNVNLMTELGQPTTSPAN